MNDNLIELIPEMISLREASSRTHISYDRLRKFCLEDKVVYIRSGNKFLINFGKLIDYLNTGDHHDE